jgi:endoglucanase
MGGIPPLGNADLNNVLRTSWNHYRDTMIAEDGRPLGDPDVDDLDLDGNRTERITVSESVAYSMLRAVLMGQDGQQATDQDRIHFEQVWNWTQANMQRSTPGFQTWSSRYWQSDRHWVQQTAGNRYALDERLRDHLFAWRWVPTLNGGDSPGGIINAAFIPGRIDRKGYNAASDDFEIAVALYFASQRGWGPENGQVYRRAAEDILGDAWSNYVFPVTTEANGGSAQRYYFFAGDQFSWSGELNPSYFRPTYFRSLFTQIDAANNNPEHQINHPWNLVADSSYDVIEQSSTMMIGERAGTAHLPPNWIRLDHTGHLAASRQFPGSAGEVTGWDGFRTLYAVAQDYAWFANPRAEQYLRGANGPLSFLSSQLRDGQLPAGFHHDGTRVNYERGVGQTGGLNTPQLFPYGGYIPYFFYAGQREQALSMIDQVQGQYNPRGFWGRNENDYFAQNWVWFGLFLTNGHPNADRLISGLHSLPVPTPPAPAAVPTPLEIARMQIDPRIGTPTSDGRPRLDREEAYRQLPREQVRDVAAAIINNLYVPRSTGPQRQRLFQEIERLDQQYDHNLIAFLQDPREYWNNVIILLSVYAQQLTEQGTGAVNQIEALVSDIQYIRGQINFNDRDFGPYAYNHVRLDITEAELRAQVGSRTILAYYDTANPAGRATAIAAAREYYEEGIFLAAGAVEMMRNIDRTEAYPDYYLIATGLRAIGDLHLKTYEATRTDEAHRDDSELQRAAYYFQQLSNADNYVEIDDPTYNLHFCFTSEDVAFALNQNYRIFHHMSPADYQRGQVSMEQVQGIALARNAALLIQRPGQRTIGETLQELANVNRSIELLDETARQPDDFYLAYARAVQADLLLLLADTIKYNLWPYVAEPATMETLRGQLNALRTTLPPSGPDQIDLEHYLEEIDQILITLEGAPSQEQRVAIAQELIGPTYDRAHNPLLSLYSINEELLSDAQALYNQVPRRCAYIFAWANTKLAEIGVRRGDFIGRELRYLIPFYTDQILAERPIPEEDFLGVAQNYLLALLHVSARNRTEARQLLGSIISTVENSQTLESRYRTYFLAQARLKQAELFGLEAQDTTVNAGQRAVSRRQAEALFSQVASDIEVFQRDHAAELREMSWRPHSLLAELYSEWGNLTGDSAHALRALDECYRSDSAFDYTKRVQAILLRFAQNQSIKDYNLDLQRQYGRRESNER